MRDEKEPNKADWTTFKPCRGWELTPHAHRPQWGWIRNMTEEVVRAIEENRDGVADRIANSLRRLHG